MLSLLILFSILTAVLSHGTEHDDPNDRSHQYRHRILVDKSLSENPEAAVLRSLNSTEARRRLTTYNIYLDQLKNEVTAEKLHKLVKETRAGYASAKPFPHMSASDVFPREVLEAANLEVPDGAKTEKETGCLKGSLCFNDNLQHQKSSFEGEHQFGPATKAIFHFMKSPVFVHFLEKVSGIEEIIPDAEYRGSGIHQTMPGGYLNVHADFNLDVKNHLHRRVNVFIYMNPDWKEEYAGHLELWSRDLQRCEVRISPDLGKLVVFSSTDFSYHGHQTPLSCPPDRSRRSLALYYYTKTRPDSECLDNNCNGTFHTTLFQKTVCPECKADNKCYAATA